MDTRATGRLGEEIAANFLTRLGFTILKRNYWKPWGEIDLVAKKGDNYHFVEVKSVSRENKADVSREIGSYRPEEQVHPEKLKRLSRAVETYMADVPGEPEYQIDVVAVFLNHAERKAYCKLYQQVL